MAGAASAAPSEVLQVNVTAEVVGACGFQNAPQTLATPGNLQIGETLSHPFTLDCNTPFVIGVSAQNGALVWQGSEPANGFATTRSYDVALNVATSGAPVAPAPCDAATLTAAVHSCPFYGAVPGEGVASGADNSVGLASVLQVTWGAPPTSPRLAAGDYKDTLTVVVGPVT